MKGLIFNIQRYSIQDGPGIRTTVFMKGCPLKCIWCANPEGQKPVPEILYDKNKCNKCYKCVNACLNGAISIFQDGFIDINRRICKKCKNYSCIDACEEEAIKLVGRFVTIEKLMKEVEKDSLFYRNSNGGVTLSGGEPTKQFEFILEFLKNCKEKGIHTTLDTCGYTSWGTLKRILEYTDLVLYDIKHIDSEKHKKLTGVSNEIILNNAKNLLSAKVPTIFRIPIIPEYNDEKENIEAIARFLKEIGGKEVNLLPYHRLGIKKYERLGINYPLKIKSPNKKSLEEIKTIFEEKGLKCLII